MKISPEIERIYLQLLWSERRRSRIVSSVAAHFGKNMVSRILQDHAVESSPLSGEPDFTTLLDERDASDFLMDLATKQDSLEAATVAALRKHVSVYQQHVDEQILFGARIAGQEASRSFLANARPADKGRALLETPEAIQAIFEMTFNGFPWRKDHFLCLRSFGGSTVHFTRSPHLHAWKIGGGDPKFLYSMKSEWIKGMLDILSPETEYSSSHSIEQGEPFGLAHFHLRKQHANP